MIAVRLKGGMGNQMFQYAFGLAMAARLGTDLWLDCGVLLDRARGKDFVYRDFDLDIFQAEANFLVRPERLRFLYKLKSATWSRQVKQYALKGLPVEKEPHFHVDENLLAQPKDEVAYDGWWQSQRYFEEVETDVRKAFTFKAPILAESAELLSRIQGANSVCLNVRRTDFLTTPTLNSTNLDYFMRGVEQMAELVDSPHFFIFSDDIAWCREHLKLPHPTEVVGHEHKGFKFGNYLQLMKACKNFIIPNSSFAWWAVWLNENEDKKVIAPANWFNEGDYDTKDLVPESWMRI